MQKAFSSPRWRTKVRRVGEKMAYVQKSGKRKTRRNNLAGFSLERENVLFSNLLLSIYYIPNQFVANLI